MMNKGFLKNISAQEGRGATSITVLNYRLRLLNRVPLAPLHNYIFLYNIDEIDYSL